jgi:hypothetical protein
MALSMDSRLPRLVEFVAIIVIEIIRVFFFFFFFFLSQGLLELYEWSKRVLEREFWFGQRR